MLVAPYLKKIRVEVELEVLVEVVEVYASLPRRESNHDTVL